MKFNKNQDYWARCYCTDKFLLIQTQSGLGMVAADPFFPSHLLLPDINNHHVGDVILQALSDSRTLTVEECEMFFDLEKEKEQYSLLIVMLVKKYGYKTKRSLFKNMMSCGVHLLNDEITIKPSFHEKLEAWSGKGINESDYVVLPVNSTPSEIGAGLRLALSRCKG